VYNLARVHAVFHALLEHDLVARTGKLAPSSRPRQGDASTQSTGWRPHHYIRTFQLWCSLQITSFATHQPECDKSDFQQKNSSELTCTSSQNLALAYGFCPLPTFDFFTNICLHALSHEQHARTREMISPDARVQAPKSMEAAALAKSGGYSIIGASMMIVLLIALV
jgi:hypothetical protein